MSHGTTRREFLLGGAALLAASGGSPTRASGDPHDNRSSDPSHDPSYSEIPSRAELLEHLGLAARKAHEAPRVVDGIPVTGLPANVLEIDREVVRIIKASGVPGISLAAAKHQSLVLTRGYGKASLAGDDPVLPTTIGGWMSISKTLTVAAALALIHDKRLRLDDHACTILGDTPLLAAGQSADHRRLAITVRHLMSHTSGLFNVVETLNDPDRFQDLARTGHIRLVHDRITQADLVRIGWKEPLQFDPGRKFAYSGQGMQVLARIVEKQSGQRLDRYVARRIFEPLGIRSYYVGSYLNDEAYAKLHRSGREGLPNLCPSFYDANARRHTARDVADLPYRSWGEADACGWACTHAVDLLRYGCFLPSVIGAELMRELTIRPAVLDDGGRRVPSPMGLGWGVAHRAEKGQNYVAIQHNGAWPGQRSFAEVRSNGGAFVVQINSDNDGAFDEINRAGGVFTDRITSTSVPIIDWKEYGYSIPRPVAR